MRLCIIFLIFATETLAYVEPLDKIDPKDKTTVNQVKLEKGGIMVMEQFLENKESYNKKDDFKLEFICSKKSPERLADCRIVDYKIFKMGNKKEK